MELSPVLETRLQKLPAKRRRAVVASLNELAEELLEDWAATADLARIEAAGQAAADTVELLMGGGVRDVARVSRLLAEIRDGHEAEEMSMDELEASGRLQLLTAYRAVEEESFQVSELEEAGISRQRLAQLRRQDRLLGIDLPFQRGFLYPQWQFGRDLTPKGYLRELMKEAHLGGLDALTVHRVMTQTKVGEGASLVELCDRGRVDLALNALRTASQSGG